ncbi:MAG TPA: peptidylprolyl isomerase [Bacteroidales bacterium]|jgi:peptidyl-prolyl cis-trans isomerase SurA|nr:peptidylprolyl isomerase [Bacteroidales bacterium]
MKRLAKSLTIIALLFAPGFISAQSTVDPVILDVAGEKITRSEFLNVYQKNNVKGEALDTKALEEYLELYINFRLKVKEATELGLDTLRSFRDELAGYRKQLSAPYMVDDQAVESLISEAYQRKLNDIRASHILIRCSRQASPADTLAAWNRILSLRKRIMKGENFGKVAAENSDDESARTRTVQGRTVKGNNGDLGYFTAFDMVYPFETAAYNTKEGEVSMPVRTDYGYHLIKVVSKKPALGKVQIAHILLLFPPKATAADSVKMADSAQMVYELLRNGGDFAALAKKYSGDKSTADKGGVLPWFGVNRMIPQFIDAIRDLKNPGDYSAPFISDFGWHIIKLVERKPVGSLEDEKNDLKQKVTKSDRTVVSQKSFVDKAKKEYGYSENTTALDKLSTIVDASVFAGKWTVPADADLKETIFTIGSKSYTQADLAKYIAAHQHQGDTLHIPTYILSQFNLFSDEKCQAYADGQLENKYPEFRSLMNEYHDGILLFDLTDKKVWSKAIKDTTGLQNFYEQNKNNYLWDDRVDATIYTYDDPKITKTLKKYVKKGLSFDQILPKFNHDTIVSLSAERKKFLKGENAMVDSLNWVKGFYTGMTDDKGKLLAIDIKQVVSKEPKQLSEAKGIITADYQNYLEQEWIKELRKKYPFTVNKDVLKSITGNQ